MIKDPIDQAGRIQWALLGSFLMIAFLVTHLLLEQQRERLVSDALNNAKDDLEFLATVVTDTLQQQNYQNLGGLVESWGRQVRNTHVLRVTAPNGFVLGEYLREGAARHPHRLLREVRYSYRGLATVEFVKDLGSVDITVRRLRLELFAGLSVVALVLWRLVSLNLQRKREALALDEANSRLQDTARQLRATRSYLQNVLDSMPSTLVGVDEGGRVTMWNAKAQEVSGKPIDTVRGQPFGEALPELAGQQDRLLLAIDSGHPFRIERLQAHRNNSPQYFEVVIYPLAAEDSRGAVIRVDDITQRVQMEQLMVQTEKMMTVSGLAGGMAHEINNPLSGVLQSSQNIMRRLSPDLPANREVADALDLDLGKTREFLEKRGIIGFLEGIREAAERASRIVADMLAFSRRSTAEFSLVDINDLLDAVVRICNSDYDLKKTYDFRKIEIEKDYDLDLPDVPCDRTEIEQVLLNLLKNAAHAMAERRTAEKNRIQLSTRVEHEQAVIEVQDNGPGMNDETRQRVFEPFFTTKPIGVGTGLGLAVSYYIVTEQHKGTISVDSVRGKGTIFTIRLPMNPVSRAF